MVSGHYDDWGKMDKIDWECIQRGDFKKGEDDLDKARRYQAELLVHKEVPLRSIESLHVYTARGRNYVNEQLSHKNINLDVYITPEYFFG